MKKILSLDGGGIRGILPATILAHLEARMQTIRSDEGIKNYSLISVGTGKAIKPYFWDKTHKFGYTSWLEPIIDVLTASVAETVDFQMQQLFSASGVPDSYIRIEPPLLSSDSRMDNASPKNIRALQNAAQSYIDHNSAIFDRLIQLHGYTNT